MQLTLKPLGEQVIVITGASSGIGLVTAKEAAKRGARVVLAARNDDDLAEATQAIRDRGGRATHHVCDVSDAQQVEQLGSHALTEFGRIDTWVNNAAVSVHGRATEIPLDELRRQFDVNYWGQVHGMLTAVEHLRAKGGALINVASALADRAIPLQANYCATEHAIKAFGDSLRMELEEDGIPISVTLVKPGSIDTLLFERSKTSLGVAPQTDPPVYRPAVVAHAILEAAQRPIRDIVVGGMGKVVSLGDKLSPRLTDRYVERTTFDFQQTETRVAADRPSNPSWSAHTAAASHPRRAAVIAASGAKRAALRHRHHDHPSESPDHLRP
jgi:short-subunit dehydrogenase